jgi:hypothetical protein
MAFRLRFTPQASADLSHLEKDQSATKRLKAVRKALGWLERDPRHPSLHTHSYSQLSGPEGEKVYEAYAENKTPAAFRIFWCYGPNKDEITIVAIVPHP